MDVRVPPGRCLEELIADAKRTQSSAEATDVGVLLVLVCCWCAVDVGAVLVVGVGVSISIGVVSVGLVWCHVICGALWYGVGVLRWCVLCSVVWCVG